MIVTTAGHIDHGKTALVRALTGVDTDRLPEERARGITVDLGFAHRASAGGTMGFVDVPGHERLVRTMVAGASGVDCALLAVALDDGVMPQTREHVAVLDLLGVSRAVVALTKADRVEAGRVAAVAGEVAALLAGTGMAGAPALACDSLSGAGIPAVAAALEAAGAGQREVGRRFRLAVDRSFVLPGVGLVVAGFVHTGSVRVGDRLVVSPGGQAVRVRGVQAHAAEVAEGRAGERVALRVAGVERGQVGRGAWLVDPVLHRPTRRLDVRVRVLPGEARALKHWTAVHLHLGTADVTGRVGLAMTVAPGGGAPGGVAPGGVAVGQLVLDGEIAALCGDRFALRDASGQRTIGGGRVLDPFAPVRRGRVAPPEGWGEADDPAAFAALLAGSPAGVDLGSFRVARNLPADELVTAACVAVGGAGVSRACWAGWERGVLERLAAVAPEEWGATAEELAGGMPGAFGPAVVRGLVEAGAVRRTGFVLHLPGREVRLAAGDAALWEEARGAMAAAGLDPPRLGFLAERVGCEAEVLGALLARLARLGWVRRASAAYYLLPETAEGLAAAAREAAGDGLLTVGRFRERTGIGRHATMPVLEMFDRIGLTRRVHEGRVLAGSAVRAAGGGGEEAAEGEGGVGRGLAEGLEGVGLAGAGGAGDLEGAEQP